VRRLLNDVASYLAELTGATRRGWNTFFFRSADPTPVGLIRVAAGLLAFWSLLVFGLDLRDYFGSQGWADPGVIRTLERPLAWSFWFAVPDASLRPVWCVCLAVLGLYTFGLFSRLTSVLSWVIVVSTVRRVPIALYGFDQILSTLMFYLAVTGAGGQAVSLGFGGDGIRLGRKQRPVGRSSGTAAQAGASCRRSRASRPPRCRPTWPCG
jgi:hypothetical protein